MQALSRSALEYSQTQLHRPPLTDGGVWSVAHNSNHTHSDSYRQAKRKADDESDIEGATSTHNISTSTSTSAGGTPPHNKRHRTESASRDGNRDANVEEPIANEASDIDVVDAGSGDQSTSTSASTSTSKRYNLLPTPREQFPTTFLTVNTGVSPLVDPAGAQMELSREREDSDEVE